MAEKEKDEKEKDIEIDEGTLDIAPEDDFDIDFDFTLSDDTDDWVAIVLPASRLQDVSIAPEGSIEVIADEITENMWKMRSCRILKKGCDRPVVASAKKPARFDIPEKLVFKDTTLKAGESVYSIKTIASGTYIVKAKAGEKGAKTITSSKQGLVAVKEGQDIFQQIDKAYIAQAKSLLDRASKTLRQCKRKEDFLRSRIETLRNRSRKDLAQRRRSVEDANRCIDVIKERYDERLEQHRLREQRLEEDMKIRENIFASRNSGNVDVVDEAKKSDIKTKANIDFLSSFNV